MQSAGRTCYSSRNGETGMAANTLRLILVLVTLLAQWPCGTVSGLVRAAEVPEGSIKSIHKCGCCQHEELPPLPDHEPLQPEPDRSTHCPCPLCSLGHVPLIEAVSSGLATDSSESPLTLLSPADARTGHRLPLDRPPRLAV